MTRIHLISTPRNLSTALMYAFAQRGDTTVVDEPLYAHYLTVSGVVHPAQEEILASQSHSGQEVIEEVILGKYDTPVLFLKNMAHHLIDLELDFLKEVTTVFLIRNPRQLIASYAKVREQPTPQDIGLERQCEIFKILKKNNHPAIVLDSGELLKNPPLVLSQLCEAIGVDFDENMLSWEAGARKEDGVWAPHWYANVHQSTGFEKQPTSSRPLPEYLAPLYQMCKPFYDFLYNYSIKG